MTWWHVSGLRQNVGCRFCGKSWWESMGSDVVTLLITPDGFQWWHPECVEWCNWKWEVSREERGRILTELTRLSETVEGGYQ